MAAGNTPVCCCTGSARPAPCGTASAREIERAGRQVDRRRSARSRRLTARSAVQRRCARRRGRRRARSRPSVPRHRAFARRLRGSRARERLVRCPRRVAARTRTQGHVDRRRSRVDARARAQTRAGCSRPRQEAWSRYRKVSGLDSNIATDEAVLARGVVATDGGSIRLAADPRTPLVAGAPFDTLASSARCPVLLARGGDGPMVTLDELRRHCPKALEIPRTGHNAHVEAPAVIVALVRSLAQRQALTRRSCRPQRPRRSVALRPDALPADFYADPYPTYDGTARARTRCIAARMARGS